MRKWTWLITSIFLLLSTHAFAADKAILLDINGAIGPAVQDYVSRGISTAVQEKAKLVILQINTPGGLETSMRGINEAIIKSPIPVIGYVAPAGARAASAGTFILYATNFAAMAPGTNLGAASPVRLTAAQQTDEKLIDTHEKKAMSDASAYIRSLAQMRGRNVTWAESAVRKAASLSAQEAKKLNVINAIAKDIPDLLKQADGKLTKVDGKQMKIESKALTVKHMPPDWRSEFLGFITNPNVAYLLMLAALYGLFFEFSNPGSIFPGVTGVICLLLALYAFQLMPVNYVGLSLIVLGVIFMVAEVYTPTYGVVGIGGIIAFVIGSIMLYDSNDPTFRITTTLILFMSTVTAAIIFLVLWMAIRAHKKHVVTGNEGMLGSDGVVVSVEDSEVFVRVMGEIWSATSQDQLQPGQHVTVTETHGLTLKVKLNKE